MKKVILKKPRITEKALKEATRGIFTFEVEKSARKGEVKKVIEEMFGVHVERIASLIVKGKKRKFGRRRKEISGQDYKKVMVKLKPGEKIDLFAVGEKK